MAQQVMLLVSLLHSPSVNRVHSLPYVPSTWVVWQDLHLVESSLLAKFDGTFNLMVAYNVSTENNEGKKIQVVIGRTGEISNMDVKI
jgi:hypothetical protein